MPLSSEENRARLTVRRLLGIREMRPADLARRAGYTPQTISDKLNGGNRIRLGDFSALSAALGVEPYVLLMEPDDAVRWALDNAPVTSSEAGMAELPFLLGVVGAFVAALVSARQPALGMWMAENQRDDDVMSGDDVASLSPGDFSDIWGFRPPVVHITTHGRAQFPRRMCSAHTHASGPEGGMEDAPERLGARRVGRFRPRACRPGEREPRPAGRAEGVAEVSP